MSFLEQDIPKKERVEEILELDVGNDNRKKYKVEAILKSAIYMRK